MALTGTLVGAYRQRTEFSNSIFEFLPQNIYQQVVVFQIFSGVRTIRPYRSKCAGLTLDLIATLRSSPDTQPPRWGCFVIEFGLV